MLPVRGGELVKIVDAGRRAEGKPDGKDTSREGRPYIHVA
jgi:hypothetical protein